MGEFQLILLGERERPARLVQGGTFSLIRFPVEIRMAATASERELTAEEIASWFTPIEAYGYAASCVGLKSAEEAMWQLLKNGMVEAIATSSSVTPSERNPITTSEPVFIPKGRWQHLSNPGTDLWNGGYARFWVSKDTGYGVPVAYQYFGIKLNPDDVRAHLPPPNPVHQAEIERVAARSDPAQSTEQPDPEPAPSPNKGGRPRKDFWDDLWAEVCGRIYEGALIPERQADIEKVMLDWATNHGHELSEAGARQRARILFNRLKNARLKT